MERKEIQKQPWFQWELSSMPEYLQAFDRNPSLGVALTGLRANNPAYLPIEAARGHWGFLRKQKSSIAQFSTLTDGFAAFLTLINLSYSSSSTKTLTSVMGYLAKTGLFDKAEQLEGKQWRKFLSSQLPLTTLAQAAPKPSVNKIYWVDFMLNYSKFVSSERDILFYKPGYLRFCASAAWEIVFSSQPQQD